MKHLIFLLIYIAVGVITGCAVKQPVTTTQEDVAQLEETKNFFISQIENDMHPIIWEYLDEVLHDPDSFRLQRFEYTLGYYLQTVSYEKKLYWFGDQTETVYEKIPVPAYHIKMRYRVRIPAGGIMLKEMVFYLLKNKKIVLPNDVQTSLIY